MWCQWLGLLIVLLLLGFSLGDDTGCEEYQVRRQWEVGRVTPSWVKLCPFTCVRLRSMLHVVTAKLEADRGLVRASLHNKPSLAGCGRTMMRRCGLAGGVVARNVAVAFHFTHYHVAGMFGDGFSFKGEVIAPFC